MAYKSPRGLIPFQAEGVARSYLGHNRVVSWATGLGKTHLGMALGSLLLEDGLIDRVIVAAEAQKVDDWVEDFGRFTDLDVLKYKGAPSRRANIRKKMPTVICATYETLKMDLSHTVKEGRKKKGVVKVGGPLLDLLVGERILYVCDEMPIKLGASRTSGNYIAHSKAMRELRKEGDVRWMALTATPIERSPENIFNVARIVAPGSMPTVAVFEERYVKAKDNYDKAIDFKNLTPEDLLDPGVTPFRDVVAPILLRKRKTDPDVVEHFPKQVEEFEYVDLHPRHLDLYNTVEDVFGEDPTYERSMYRVLRMIAGHPMSLLHSQDPVAKMLVSQIGEDGLRKIPVAKLDRLLEDLDTVCNTQGEQVVVFTHFANLILPWIHYGMKLKGLNVAVGTDRVTHDTAKDAERAFKAGQNQIFLASDKSARGINLPNASYVFNYEAPTSHSTYVQRIDRCHRIDSVPKIVHARTYVALDTIEEATIQTAYVRNEWHDQLIDHDADDDAHLTAADRRRLRKMAKRAAEDRSSLPRTLHSV
jgi:SNF2 family DNA or RNA helicase